MAITVKTWEAYSQVDKDRFFSRSELNINEVLPSVEKIISTVRDKKDKALAAYTREFDDIDISRMPLMVQIEEFSRAEAQLDSSVKEAIDYAIENVRRFHLLQKPEASTLNEIRPGVLAGERPSPIDSVGIYVPRGRGSFPSMLYMTALPAVIAGVKNIQVVTPASQDGAVDPAVLYTALKCGINKVFRVGGAHAIAALAYGTESINPVVKITGPGSMYVAAAKRVLYGIVDTGLPAGPSESVIIADGSTSAHNAALDLLVEAEHGSDSSAVLLTPDTEFARKTAAKADTIIQELTEPRKTFVQDVLSGYGGIIVTESIDEACCISNKFAPEHLLLLTEDPFDTMSKITNAGEILLGEHVPFSAANYVIGANAVLPTGGGAKTWSSVSVRDFIKYSSVVYVTRNGYNSLKNKVVTLADYEGFQTHAKAIQNRTNDT